MAINRKINFLSSLVVVICFLVIAGIFVYCLEAKVVVNKISDPNVINLPQALKQRLISDPDSELLYIDYHDRKLEYFFISHNTVRVKVILRVLRKIIISLNNDIPEGHYLLVLRDALPHPYEVPVLAFASHKKYLESKDVILIPDTFALNDYQRLFRSIGKARLKFPWYKKEAKVFIRGSATGAGIANNDINGFPRLRFMNYVKDIDIVDAAFTDYTRQYNQDFLQKLSTLHPLKPYTKPHNSLQYKYLIDIDGNTCSYSRMAWILYSNSLLLKHTSDQVQWYYHMLKP
ncbi:MAG: hypothetical protein KC414_10940, partial [Romboutsia sp.]|nr:hypothetical protein [Romboutsia sp.]